MSRVVASGEIMMRLATPGFARFQQAMPGSANVTIAGCEWFVISGITPAISRIPSRATTAKYP